MDRPEIVSPLKLQCCVYFKKFVLVGFNPIFECCENSLLSLTSKLRHHPRLIRPSNGIGVFQAANGPRMTVYNALIIPLPRL